MEVVRAQEKTDMSNRVRVTGWKWGGKKKSNNVREKKRLERNDS